MSGNPMKRLMRTGLLPSLLLACAGTTGCGTPPAAPPPPPPPEVLVSTPLVRSVTDYEDFPGRTEAVVSVEIRARVTGYLDKVYFQEGAEVKQGDVLFEIDPRPYRAAYDQAVGNLTAMEARVNRLDSDLAR